MRYAITDLVLVTLTNQRGECLQRLREMVNRFRVPSVPGLSFRWAILESGSMNRVPSVEWLQKDHLITPEAPPGEESFRNNLRGLVNFSKEIGAFQNPNCWLMFLEDDDFYGVNYLEMMLNLIRENPTGIIAGSAAPRWYHLGERKYTIRPRGQLASLAQTAIRGTLLGTILQHSNRKQLRQLDGHLWKRSHIPAYGKNLDPESLEHIGLKGYPDQDGLGVCHTSIEVESWTADPDGAKLVEWSGGDPLVCDLLGD